MLCHENHRYYLSVSILLRIQNSHACCLREFYFTDSLGQNFPSYDQGKVLGIAKSYFGISSAFFASFDNNFAHGNVNVFMFCFLFFIPVVVMINAWCIRPLPKNYAKQYNCTNNNSDDSQLISAFCIIVIASIIRRKPVTLLNYDTRVITIQLVSAVLFAVIIDRQLLVMTVLIFAIVVIIEIYLVQSIFCTFREIVILSLFDCHMIKCKSKISFIKNVATKFIKMNATLAKTVNVLLAQRFTN